jgi:hypothetical protein
MSTKPTIRLYIELLSEKEDVGMWRLQFEMCNWQFEILLHDYDLQQFSVGCSLPTCLFKRIFIF